MQNRIKKHLDEIYKNFDEGHETSKKELVKNFFETFDPNDLPPDIDELTYDESVADINRAVSPMADSILELHCEHSERLLNCKDRMPRESCSSELSAVVADAGDEPTLYRFRLKEHFPLRSLKQGRDVYIAAALAKFFIANKCIPAVIGNAFYSSPDDVILSSVTLATGYGKCATTNATSTVMDEDWIEPKAMEDDSLCVVSRMTFGVINQYLVRDSMALDLVLRAPDITDIAIVAGK